MSTSALHHLLAQSVRIRRKWISVEEREEGGLINANTGEREERGRREGGEREREREREENRRE